MWEGHVRCVLVSVVELLIFCCADRGIDVSDGSSGIELIR